MRILRPSEIRALRAKHGLTQSKLAELAGVSQAYIAKIESGAADPRLSTLEKISRALERFAEESPLTAERIMATPIVYVSPNDEIKKAIELMESNGISQLPVLEGETQLGSISETTIIQKILSSENIPKLIHRTVGEIMEEPFPTVSRKADIDTIYHILEHHPALLVTDKGRPVGIITKADILKLAVEEGDSKS